MATETEFTVPEKSPPSKADVGRLMESMDDLRGELSEHKNIVARGNRRGWVGLVLATVGVIGIVVVMFVAKQNSDAADENEALAMQNQAALAEILATRAERTATTCTEYNKFVAKLHEKLPEALLALVPAEVTLTDAQNAQVAAYAASVVDGFEFRDCTPEGIAAYFEDQ